MRPHAALRASARRVDPAGSGRRPCPGKRAGGSAQLHGRDPQSEPDAARGQRLDRAGRPWKRCWRAIRTPPKRTTCWGWSPSGGRTCAAAAASYATAIQLRAGAGRGARPARLRARPAGPHAGGDRRVRARRPDSTRRCSTRSITSARRAGGRAISPARCPPLQAAVKLQPDHAEARYYLGLTLESQGRLEPAIDELRDGGPAESARWPSAQARLGIALQAFGDLDGAIAHLRPRCASIRRRADAQNSLGLALSQKGRGDEAVAVLRRARRGAAGLRPGAAESRHRADAAGQPRRRGRPCYRALIALDPGNAEAFYNLGLALKQQDDFAGAEVELRQAVRSIRALPEAPFTLGVVLWQTGRADEAAAAVPRSPRAQAGLRRRALHARHGAEAAGRARRRDRAVPRGDRVSAGVCRGAPEPRPGAQTAGRHGRPAAAELAEADRLNKEQGRRAGVDVRGRRRRAEAQGGRLRRRDRAVPRGRPPRGRQPAGALSARAGAATHRRARPRRATHFAEGPAARAVPDGRRHDEPMTRLTRAGESPPAATAAGGSRSLASRCWHSRAPARGARSRAPLALLVHEHRARGRADRDHRLRRHGDQQVPARDDRLRRRGARLSTATAGSTSSSSTAPSLDGLPARAGADRPSLSQPARRHLRGRDRASRA